MEEANEFKLGENEKIVRVVLHHPEIIFLNLVISFLILILDFFLMYFFFLQGTWGIIVFLAILFIVASYVFRLVFLYRTNKFVLTNQRIVDFEQTGFWAKRISAVSYAKIVAVEAIVKGVRAHWLKYGNLRLDLGKNGRSFELYKIKRPIEVQAIINEIMTGKFDFEENKVEELRETLESPEQELAQAEEPVVQPVFKSIEIREPKKEKLDQNEAPEKKLNKISQVLQDVESLSVREKEDLLCVLEEELREVSRDA